MRSLREKAIANYKNALEVDPNFREARRELPSLE